jgi:hypothetical protein
MTSEDEKENVYPNNGNKRLSWYSFIIIPFELKD